MVLYQYTLPEFSWILDQAAVPPKPEALEGLQPEVFPVVEMGSLLQSPLTDELASPKCSSDLWWLLDWSGWFVSQLKQWSEDTVYLVEVYALKKL